MCALYTISHCQLFPNHLNWVAKYCINIRSLLCLPWSSFFSSLFTALRKVKTKVSITLVKYKQGVYCHLIRKVFLNTTPIWKIQGSKLTNWQPYKMKLLNNDKILVTRLLVQYYMTDTKLPHTHITWPAFILKISEGFILRQLNTLPPKISLVILLTVSCTVLVMFIWRILFWINL